jgi:hypothetical protein
MKKKLNPAFPITTFFFLFLCLLIFLIIKQNPKYIKEIFGGSDSITIYAPQKIFHNTMATKVLESSLTSKELKKKLLDRKYNKEDSIVDEMQKMINLRILRKAIMWDYLPEGSTTNDLTIHIKQLMFDDGMLNGSNLNDTIY